jgi:hypothetical protein
MALRAVQAEVAVAIPVQEAEVSVVKAQMPEVMKIVLIDKTKAALLI